MWVKLLNSGDTLKLLVPNYSWKAISGWINYSYMVISQKMIEREMGYRGSKSEFQILQPNFISNFIFCLKVTLFVLLLFEFSDYYNDLFLFSGFTPILIYTNYDPNKINILKDNKNKSGVYRWINKKSGKSYIGSSVKL
jgi:hypothetical protein